MKKEIEEVLNSNLKENEVVLWSGQPNANVWIHPNDIFWIPISIPFGLVSVVGFIYEVVALICFIENGHLGYQMNIEEIIFLIPFIILGFYLTIGRFIMKKALKKDTIYAITNERAIVVKGKGLWDFDYKYFSKINTLEKHIRKDGIGTIYFGKMNTNTWAYGNLFNASLGVKNNDTLIFYDIDKAEVIYKLANSMLKDNKI